MGRVADVEFVDRDLGVDIEGKSYPSHVVLEVEERYMNSSLANLKPTSCTLEINSTTKQTRVGVALDVEVQFKVEVRGQISYANHCLPLPFLLLKIRSTSTMTAVM